jgi:iron complex transport system permease protein
MAMIQHKFAQLPAVFGAIHFYTQWFERLGPGPLSFIIGGLLMLAFALGLWAFNKRYASHI